MKSNFARGVAVIALMVAWSASQPVFAQTNTSNQADTVNEVVVYGHGQIRQSQQVKAAEITIAAPGTSPLKIMDKLPGVTFQSADPFGAYEWSTRISVRGFNQNQIGFTLDGVTLGDMSYGNYNGLHISRAIINEDIGTIDMAQGAGSLDSATSSNMGGTLKFTSRDPAEELGGELAGTYGSNETHRIYGRFETGSIEALGGLRGFISAVDQKADKWKGGSEQRAFQIDTKWVLPIGQGSLTAFFDHSERREQDYQDLSIAMINAGGYNIDNFQPNYAAAIGVASVLNNMALYLNGTLDPSSGYWTGNGTNPYLAYGVANPDVSYYYGAGVRDDNLGAIKLELPINDMISLNANVYHHDDKGQGLWVTPYTVSPNFGVVGATSDNAPLSIRTTEYDIDRNGISAGLVLNLGQHKVSGGVWYENNDFNQARRFYAEDLTAPKRDSLGFQSNPFTTSWAYNFNTETQMFYLQDEWNITEQFKLNYGFKALNVTNTAHGTVTTAPLDAKLKSEDSFIPQIGAVYKISDNYEVFGSYSENMNAFVSAATSGPFSSRSQTNVNYVRDHLKPESSRTFEGGVRVRIPHFQGVAALYHVDFSNRILSIAQGAGIVGNAPVLSNVGDVKTNGLELAGTYRFNHDIKLYASYSYNISEYDDNVTDSNGAIIMATKGKTVVNTPKNLFKAELNYDNGTWFGSLGVDYTGERYYTYTNIGGLVPSTTIADLSVGYRFNSIGTEIQLNVTNLTGEKYISTIGSNGFVASDPTNTSATVLAGAPRQVFISVRKQF